ncbi:MAG TPA: thioredoxin family protein [Cyclobacteriaceae bacterium]|nr:thioredoxin family protein [Cyclobacteriaceae bacterium]
MKTILILVLILILNPAWKNSEHPAGYQVGDFVADFSLKNIDGKFVSLSDYKEAKGFIIAFTCNTCPFAILYEQRIIDLHKKYSSKGYPVIAINPNDPTIQPGDSFENMQRRAKDKNYPFPYLADVTQETTRAYGATNTPHLYILKKIDGKYKVSYIGTIDNNPKEPQGATRHYIDEAMDQILTGKEVKEPETKAVGCSIKWKPA